MRGAANETDRRIGWAYHHVRGVGGSTLHYLGEAHRLHPAAMSLRADSASAPTGLRLRRARAVLRRGRTRDRRRRPAGLGRAPARPLPAPGAPAEPCAQRIAEGCGKLGLTLRANSLAILSTPYQDRPNCNYCANCIRGCPRADKGSADITFVAPAVATGRCSVETDWQAVFVEPGKDDRVAAVHCVDGTGAWRTSRGRAYVIACGAVNTPRLLLASTNGHAPHGLANDPGGRPQLHGNAVLDGERSPSPAARQPSRRAGRRHLLGIQRARCDAGGIGGCRFTAGAGQADLVGPIGYATRVVDGWGPEHRARLRDAFGSA